MSDSVTTNTPDLTVSELAASLKRTIETNFDHIRVRGELGRVTIARSGHMYADIKDEKAVLNTVMWKGQVNALSFRPEEGLEVVAEGKLSIYAGRSNYQLIASSMRPAGAGALMALLEERKKKFAAEGLFDQKHKKQLPYLPSTIGVVTSPTGAVIRDILHRVEDRFPVRVILWPALVQGELAAAQITTAIEGFNAMTDSNRPDVLIVGRGGGSIEDLWPFNEESVVRAAFASEIPLISAVGHETDTTLIDYVSDARAPTPTGAAEIAVPVRSELLASVDESGSRLRRSLLARVSNLKDRLRAARLPRADTILTPKRQRFDYAEAGLKRGLQAAVDRKSIALTRISARLRPEALPLDLKRRKDKLREVAVRARPALNRLHARLSDRLSSQSKLLETLSYQATLQRGFAVARDTDGTILRSAAAANQKTALRLTFADGDVHVEPMDAPGQPKLDTAKPPKSTKPKTDQGSLF
ncbi:MAG: exodeoxyribonuclease VII large subunit [Pseudomonadota bacterium]